MLLLIDNYDSFAHNLARYFTRLGCDTRVARNDAISVDEVRQAAPDAIVLSPGPCTPQEAGCSLDLVRQLHDQVPILGVCLGHQTIASALGGQIVRCPPMHGRTSPVYHDQLDIFEGIPSPFRACRYHSLAVDQDTMPDELRVIGTTDNNVIMAIRHRKYPVIGLQFHPEAILSEHGFQLLANFLQLAKVNYRGLVPGAGHELQASAPHRQELPHKPVTF